MYLIVYITAKC